MDKLRIGIIGAGAAGYFAAITCAENFRSAHVTILESSRQPLYKVGISGGGRCNVTHNCFDVDRLIEGYPRGHKELIGPFSRFQPRDTVRWFESRGVRLKAEPDGRMFPITDDSATIIQCLQSAAAKAGVNLEQQKRVERIEKSDSGEFVVHFKDSAPEHYDRVLLATGSSPSGYRIAQSLGHTIVAPMPSLFTFKIKDQRLHELSGLSFEDAVLELHVEGFKPLSWRGPILITHWGLSGPAVLKLSAWGARQLFASRYQADLVVNLLGDTKPGSLLDQMHRYRNEHPTRTIQNNNFLPVPKRYWERIVGISGIEDGRTWSHITKEQQQQLCDELTRAKFRITGKGEFKEEFVTAGGAKLKEVDFRTMESRICRGLFFAGEILDIDGITGGFNFQAAWSTGWVAGKSIGLQSQE